MKTKKAIDLLERMREPEAWEPKITADAEEALGMGIDAIKEVEQLHRDIDEMHFHIRAVENKLAEYKAVIRALEFVVRCNSVSGGDVKDGAI